MVIDDGWRPESGPEKFVEQKYELKIETKKMRWSTISTWCITCGKGTKFTAAGTEETNYGDGHCVCKECGSHRQLCPGC